MLYRKYTIKGVRPLIMHNEQLSDPLNKWTRLVAEISKKRKKTEDDLLEMSKREWFGGLYLDADDRVIVPEKNLERMLRDAAAKSKRGKDVQAGLIVLNPAVLEYEGPNTPDALWKSGNFLIRASVGVGRQRVIRSRPWFEHWSLTFIVAYDETVLEARDVDSFVEVAGRLIGLCDWRPKHGRFEVTEASVPTDKEIAA